MTTTEAQAIRDAIAKHIVLYPRSELRLILDGNRLAIMLMDGEANAEHLIGSRTKEEIEKDAYAARRIANGLVTEWATGKYIK